MTLSSVFRDACLGLLRRPVTVRYPAERRPVPTHLRGALTWKPEGCTGCGLCVKDCPSGAIELITLDKAAKRFVVRYQTDRCVFCSQCVQSCRFNCLELSPTHWELAALTKKPFTLLYGDQSDVDTVLGRPAPANTKPAR